MHYQEFSCQMADVIQLMPRRYGNMVVDEGRAHPPAMQLQKPSRRARRCAYKWARSAGNGGSCGRHI